MEFKLENKNPGFDGNFFKSKKELHKFVALISEDFKKYFPWMVVTSYDPGIRFCLLTFKRNRNKEYVETLGESVNLPLEIIYTMLKNVGADVDKYNLKEVYITKENLYKYYY